MDWTKKHWGKTKMLSRNEISGTHIIEISQRGYCSQHMHSNLSNAFYVISGKLEIICWYPEGDDESRYLGPDDYLDVPAGVWHRFINRAEKTVCLELYRVAEHRPDNITRLDEGGQDFKLIDESSLYKSPYEEYPYFHTKPGIVDNLVMSH